MRALISFCISLFLVSISMTACSDSAKKRNSQLVYENVKAAIDKQLPKGSSQRDVLSFLDAQSIEHSDYVASTRAIYAIIREQNSKGLVRRAVQIEFQFDDIGRLEQSVVKELFTGP